MYVLFIAICTQCLINIVDSFAQFRDPLVDNGEYALIRDRKEFNFKEGTHFIEMNAKEADNMAGPGTRMEQKQI
jgi:hypothetical protein